MSWITGPKKLVEAAVFYSQKLGIKQDYTLEIHKKKLNGMHGLCEFDFDKHFDITLEKRNKLRGESIYESLAHEMVHVKQFLEAEANGNYPAETYALNEVGEDAYWDDPWEIEAFGRQLGLYLRWKKYKEGSK